MSWQLRNEDNEVVVPGEIVTAFDGEDAVLGDPVGCPPHIRSSTGRVYVLIAHGEDAVTDVDSFASYYPSVYKLKWHHTTESTS